MQKADKAFSNQQSIRHRPKNIVKNFMGTMHQHNLECGVNRSKHRNLSLYRLGIEMLFVCVCNRKLRYQYSQRQFIPSYDG